MYSHIKGFFLDSRNIIGFRCKSTNRLFIALKTKSLTFNNLQVEAYTSMLHTRICAFNYCSNIHTKFDVKLATLPTLTLLIKMYLVLPSATLKNGVRPQH